MESIIRDIKLAKSGHEKISWVDHYMPALNAIGDELAKDQTFKGKTVCVSGHLEAKTAYLAEVLHRAGANVIVTEVDTIKAIEAVFDGFEVLPMAEAAKVGDIFVTLTGDKDVIRGEHMKNMKDGVILANAGHFDVEINRPELEALAVRHFEARHNIEGYELPDGRIIILLAEGRLVILAAGDGHPAEIMDLSFAVQALAAKYILEHHAELGNHVYVLPRDIDMEIAKIKLRSMGYSIDTLTEEQRKYLNLD